MKKLFLLFLISALFLGVKAQHPYCIRDSTTTAGKVINLTDHINSNAEEGCPFRFVLWDPLGYGWVEEEDWIAITVDGIDYGTVTLPYGTPSLEVIKLLPSGEVQCTWNGYYQPIGTCFNIYNSYNELIYENPYPGLPDVLFLIYQNECQECIPITDFEGEYIQEAKQVNLSWKAPENADVTGFDIFRNGELIEQVAPSVNFYSSLTDSLEDGVYRYCVLPIYTFVCTFEDECFETYVSNVGINNYSTAIRIYPNPANTVINISGNVISEVRIYNNIGQILLIQRNTNIINVSGLTKGLYMLTAETSTGNIIHKKIIINH